VSGCRIVISPAAGHAALSYSVVGLARHELVVTDFKGAFMLQLTRVTSKCRLHSINPELNHAIYAYCFHRVGYYAPICWAKSMMLLETTSKSPGSALSGTPAGPPPYSFGR
jgi:hypothetical protein